jgi:hypothetical protein
VALVLGLLWAVERRSMPVTGFRGALDVPIAVFLGWSALSLVGAAEPAAGLAVLGHWTACGVVYLLVSRAAGPGDVPRLAAGLLLGGAGVAAVGLGQALFGLDWVPQAAAPAATLANRNVAAAYLAAVAPLALVAWPRRGARVAAALAAVPMLAFLPFARSRAAFLAVALQLVLLAVVRLPGRGRPASRRSRGPGVAQAVLMTMALALAGAAAWVSLADAQKARSASIRGSLALGAAAMAVEHPLLGVGLGGFAGHYPSRGPVLVSARGGPVKVESPHQEGLQVVAETGWPGLAAALWLALAVTAVLRRLRTSPEPAVRQAALALGLSLTGFAVDAAFGFPLRYPVPPLVLAVLLGLLAALDASASPATAPAVARRERARPFRAARFASLGARAGLAALPALALVSSTARLREDRAAFAAAFLPAAHAQSRAVASCAAGVALDRAADGRLDLSARAVPLADLLQCLVERTGLRVEYEGAPLRQPVSVALRGETLAGTLQSLLEGLGVNYLLTRDPSGADRLIVFGASREAEPQGTARPSPGSGQPEAIPPPEDVPADETQPFGVPPAPGAPGMAPGMAPSFPAPPGSEPSGVEAPPEEPPYVPGPEELTPLTLQFGRGPGPRVASMAGNSPVR